MKRYIVLLIICILSIFETSNAFFGSPSSLDLYKNIDKGIDELDNKMFEFEINGGVKGTSIIKEINKLARSEGKKSCLDESQNISIDDIEEIIIEEDIGKISDYIDDSCVNNETFTTELLSDYLLFFNIYYDKVSNLSKEKAKQIYQISNIGLYSDGKIENSGFDLITDIEDIDKIIFADVKNYEGGDNIDLGESIYGLLSDIGKGIKDTISSNSNEVVNNPNTSLDTESESEAEAEQNQNEIINPNIESSDSINTKNIYICSDDIDKSGLSENNLELILNNINSDIGLSNDNQLANANSSLNGNIVANDEVQDENQDSNQDIGGGYSKITDLSEWPCNKFFCIDIEYITYEHNLFGGGENVTIEYLLNRSNEHLGKFASTSLLPASMSTNNFELGFKNLNLPDIFHIGFQISTKPVPILDLSAEGKKDESEYASKNMLETFYKANGLDYKRRNDLSLFKSEEQKKQTAANSITLANERAFKNQNQYIEEYLVKNISDSKLINTAIEKEVSNGVLKTFEKQYIELDKFTQGINNYVNDVNSLIGKMNEIPNG